MSRSRILKSIAAATIGITLFGACSAESFAERAVEFGLEQAAEGDQDIDLDFDSEGGGFSVSTDEGDFAINFDEDSGGIVFDTEEGEGVISFDENGIVYETDEGDGVISFDQDNGTINFDTDQGDGAIVFDEEAGTVSVQTDDGEFDLQTGQTMPATWPAWVGAPASLVPGSQSFSTFNTGDGGQTTAGTFEHAENDPWATQLISELENNGWAKAAGASDAGMTFAILVKGDSTVQVVAEATMSSFTMTTP